LTAPEEDGGIFVVMKCTARFFAAGICLVAIFVAAADQSVSNCVIMFEAYAVDRNAPRDLLESTRGEARYQRLRDLHKSANGVNELADDGRTCPRPAPRALKREP
jgi:hypothetical protein